MGAWVRGVWGVARRGGADGADGADAVDRRGSTTPPALKIANCLTIRALSYALTVFEGVAELDF